MNPVHCVPSKETVKVETVLLENGTELSEWQLCMGDSLSLISLSMLKKVPQKQLEGTSLCSQSSFHSVTAVWKHNVHQMALDLCASFLTSG